MSGLKITPLGVFCLWLVLMVAGTCLHLWAEDSRRIGLVLLLAYEFAVGAYMTWRFAAWADRLMRRV
jgi:hypothetical protein